MSERCPWRMTTDGGQVRQCGLDEGHDTSMDDMEGRWHGYETKRTIVTFNETGPATFNPRQAGDGAQ